MNEGETDWNWVLEAALTESIVAPYRKSTTLIQVIAPSQDDIDRLTAKLNTLGINFFNRTGPLPQRKERTERCDKADLQS